MTAAESGSEEAVEAAAAAISSKVCPGRPWGDTDDEDKPHYREEARAALAAAVPHLERRIRESIAGEARVQAARADVIESHGGQVLAGDALRAFAVLVAGSSS